MSKRLRYQVAVSLDGFIAGPNGEYDWIVMDPSIDFTKPCHPAALSPSRIQSSARKLQAPRSPG